MRGKQTQPPDGSIHSTSGSEAIQSLTMAKALAMRALLKASHASR